jgi:hypothetical protein
MFFFPSPSFVHSSPLQGQVLRGQAGHPDRHQQRPAEREWGATYIIYNPDTNEFLDFSDIIGYEPEELANGE